MFDTIKAVFAELFSKRNYEKDIRDLFAQSERVNWPEYTTHEVSFETKDYMKVRGLTMADMQRLLSEKGIQISLAKIHSIVINLRERSVIRSHYNVKDSPVRIYTRGVNF